jgi:hypothetical protein
LAILTLLSSCDDSSEFQHKSVTDINEDFKTETLKSVNVSEIGDQKSDVISRMKEYIISNIPDEITARIPLNPKDSSFYTIDYDFKQGKLNSIDLDIYPKNHAACQLLFKKFKTHYNSLFGMGQEKNDFMVWYTSAKTGNDVEIMLMNESSSRQKPYLAITFYQEENISK